MNRRGPSTEPWGMPWDRGKVEEVQLFMLINCCLIVRYDFNQERAGPVMLREDSRWERPPEIEGFTNESFFKELDFDLDDFFIS